MSTPEYDLLLQQLNHLRLGRVAEVLGCAYATRRRCEHVVSRFSARLDARSDERATTRAS